jgi:hypothetical protein
MYQYISSYTLNLRALYYYTSTYSTGVQWGNCVVPRAMLQCSVKARRKKCAQVGSIRACTVQIMQFGTRGMRLTAS